jgi:hypothetical protein
MEFSLGCWKGRLEMLRSLLMNVILNDLCKARSAIPVLSQFVRTLVRCD